MNEARADTLALRIAGYQGEASVHTRAMRAVAARLDAAGLRVDYVSDVTTLGKPAASILADVESGALDLCYFSSGYLADRVAALGVFDIPFLFDERARTQAAVGGALGAFVADAVAAQTGYRVLAFWDNGLRSLSNAVRPIAHPDDCRGLRIRTLPSAGYAATFRALGMSPVHIDIRDLVGAIERGEVDAQENPLANLKLFDLARCHRHATLTRHFHGIALVLANAHAWASWPAHRRAAIEAAMRAATREQWALAAAEDAAAHEWAAARGVAIVALDAAARDAFRAAVAPLVRQQLAALPAALRTLALGA